MLYSKIESAITYLQPETITEDRKIILQALIDYIQLKKSDGLSIRLNFICTHNSRRSQLTQIWAQVMAHHFNIENVQCYSGGSEVTAMFPMISMTLENTGFKIFQLSKGENPITAIKYTENEHPILGFSKVLDDEFNPKSGFGAVMTCSQADDACPFVPGAEKRIPITYEDPKNFDDTSLQQEKYKERSVQIATEMYYIFSQLK